MQLVIKISDTLKEILDSHDIMTASHPMWVAIMMDAIENGTPLPKGHGRLIDADDLMEIYRYFELSSDMGDAMEILDFKPTIIEAESEVTT